MAMTAEDLLVRISGQNNLSPHLSQIANDIQIMSNQMSAAEMAGVNLQRGLMGLGVAAVGVGILAGTLSLLKDSVEAAANAEHRQNILTIALGGTMADTQKTMAQWTPTINSIVESTGKMRSSIMGIIDVYAVFGVTNQDTMKRITEATTAMAYMTGKDVDKISQGLGQMIESGRVMPRTLSQYRLSLEDLGVTAEEFAQLTNDERAAVLASAIEKKGAAAANEAYRNSYEGMMERIQGAWGRFKVALGEIVLPAIMPWLEAIANGLMGLANFFKGLPTPIKQVIILIPLIVGAVLTIGGAIVAVSAMWPLIYTAAIAPFASVIALATGIFTELQIGMGLVATSSTYMGVAVGGTSTSFFAMAGAALVAEVSLLGLTAPLWVFIVAGLAVVAVIAGIITYFGWWDDIMNGIKAVISGVVNYFYQLRDALMANQVVKDVLGDFNNALKVLGDGLSWVAGGIMSILSPIGQAVSAFFGWIASALGLKGSFDMVGLAVSIITGIITVLVFPFRAIWTIATAVAGALQWVAAQFRAGGSGAGFFSGIIQTLQRVFVALKPAIDLGMKALDLFIDIIVALGRLALRALQPVWGAFVWLWGGIQLVINIMWRGILVWWNILAGIWATAMAWLQPVFDAFNYALNLVTNAMNTIWSTVSSVINNIIGAFNNLVGAVTNAVTNVANAIINNLSHAIDVLRGFICPIIGCSPGIIPAFKEMSSVVPEEINRMMPHIERLNRGMVGVPSAHITGGVSGTMGRVGSAIHAGSTTKSVHHHNETITIDAKHLNERELSKLIISIYRGNFK